MDTNENSNIISYDTTHPSYIFLKKIQDYSPTFLQYYRLWLQTKSEAEHDTDFEKDYEPSYIENVLWSSLEKQRFFKALERCGPYNYEEIQRRVGPTKTVLQVKIYGEYLKAASEIEGIDKDSKAIIPFANEMTDQWIKEEEKLAQDLSSFTDQQAQAINMYHTSELHEYVSFQRYAHQIYLKDPHCKQVRINKKKLNKKKKDMGVFSEMSDCIDLSGLSTLATKYNKNTVITEETKLILHRLLIQFLKDVIIKAHWLQRRNGNKIYKKRSVSKSQLQHCIPAKYLKKYDFRSDIFGIDKEEKVEDMDSDDDTDDDNEGDKEMKMKNSDSDDSDNEDGSESDETMDSSADEKMKQISITDHDNDEEMNSMNNKEGLSKNYTLSDNEEDVSFENSKYYFSSDDDDDDNAGNYKSENNVNDGDSESDKINDDEPDESDDAISTYIDDDEQEEKEEEEFKNILAQECQEEAAMLETDIETENFMRSIINL